MTISQFQDLIKRTYFDRDGGRGVAGTFLWFAEEVGELARALQRGSAEQKLEEFSDALAWLVSLATLAGVDMEKAAQRYADGCPKCKRIPCSCPS